ncbi:MAG: MiaB/RimO family radical SAM methylthiotransferase [Gemmatimonadales bacterium]|nr:MAG: MiaB/RimO family radical SAM methylthiotransferase [Gemmatimonadales bacterium]
MTDFATPQKRAYVETFGCQMNIADGELMQGILAADGYRIVQSPEEADVILVNTCAIRDHAERRVIGRVGQLHGLRRERPDIIIGVTGCMAQRLGTDLMEQAPPVDLIMGPDAYRTLPEELRRIRSGATAEGGLDADAASPGAPDPERKIAAGSGRHLRTARGIPGAIRKERLQLAVLDLDTGENYEGLEQRRTSGPIAWVPIQRGCDHRCTYCIVPHVRGPEKNREASDILAEIRRLSEDGVSEVTLLGQTVNSYRAGAWSFPDLLRAVARVDGIRRVRFMSPHPADVTPELVEVMATEPSVCEQLHLPAQSGNDRILRRMSRRYTVESFLEKVEMVRSAIPDVALSTDIIVGFPGETEAEYEDTLNLMRTVRFDDAFTYKYSLRAGTPATRLPEDSFVPDAEAQARLEVLIRLARGIQAEISRTEVGRLEEVLAEKAGRDPGDLLGRTRRGKAVTFPASGHGPGDYVALRLSGTTGATFRGLPRPAAPREPVEAGAT